MNPSEISKQIDSELSTIRSHINLAANCDSNPNITVSECVYRFYALRRCFEIIADLVQEKKELVELQREKLQKGKIFQEGLKYHKVQIQQFKGRLIGQIQKKELEIVNIAEYVDKPLSVNDWTKPNFQQIRESVYDELNRRKQLKTLQERLISEKTNKQQLLKNRRLIFNQMLPSKVRRICTELKQIQEIFDQEDKERQKKISKTISTLISKFKDLQQKKKISMEYTCNEFEILNIRVDNRTNNMFMKAKAKKIYLNQDDTFIKIANIAPDFPDLVIGTNKEEGICNQQVFNLLFWEQNCKDVFEYANCIAKLKVNQIFTYLRWVQEGLLSGSITPQKFIEAIQTRIFCLRMIEYIKRNIKDLESLYSSFQKNIQLQSEIKQTYQAQFNRITFKKYLQLSNTPLWVEDYLKTKIEHDSPTQAQERPETYYQFLKCLNLEQYFLPQSNLYFQGKLVLFGKNIEFLLIVPMKYPLSCSTLKIFNYQQQTKPEISPFPMVKINIKCNVNQNLLPVEALKMEKTINKESFNQQSKELMMLFQIWKIIQHEVSLKILDTD